MPDPLLVLVQTLSGATGEGVSSSVQADLSWAAFHLGAARIGSRLLEQLIASSDGQPLTGELGEERDSIETAVMTLGFGNVKTALDLCANAALTLGQAQGRSDWFFSIESLMASVSGGYTPQSQRFI